MTKVSDVIDAVRDDVQGRDQMTLVLRHLFRLLPLVADIVDEQDRLRSFRQLAVASCYDSETFKDRERSLVALSYWHVPAGQRGYNLSLAVSEAFQSAISNVFQRSKRCAELSLADSFDALRDTFPRELRGPNSELDAQRAFFADELGADLASVIEYDRGYVQTEPLWAKHIRRDAPFEISQQNLLFVLRDEKWRFWIRWYEAALAGEPLTSDWTSHWQLLTEIALIPDADWDQGAEHIAGLIAAIEARFALPEDMMLARALPLAESVEINPESGKFRVVPVPVQNTPLIGAVLARAADALDDALGGNSGLTDASREARVIRRVISRYGNDPQRIEMDFVSVAAGMRRQFENGDLPEDEMNLGLFEAVEEGVRAIRASHADVAENRAVLAGQRVAEMTAEERALMQEALPMLIEASEGALAMEFDEDIAEMLASPLVADRAPIGGKAPPLPGMVRTFSRVAKISLLDRSSQVISKVDGSAGYKGLRMIGTGKSIIDLVRLGLDWLGVI